MMKAVDEAAGLVHFTLADVRHNRDAAGDMSPPTLSLLKPWWSLTSLNGAFPAGRSEQDSFFFTLMLCAETCIM